MHEAAARVRSASKNAAAGASGSGAGASSAHEWLSAVGAALYAAASQASDDVSGRVDAALHEAKPLVLSGMFLLPDMARVFTSLVHGQVRAPVCVESATLLADKYSICNQDL
jgi:hypothetical protein